MSEDGTVYLVSCVAKKLQEAAPASDLYVSPWFQMARRYVERREGKWFILSALHGLVEPYRIIAPYEMTLNKTGVADRQRWATRVIEAMDRQMPDCRQLVVFAGQRYREFLMDYLRQRVPRVAIPLEGLAIGRQLKWFNDARPS